MALIMRRPEISALMYSTAHRVATGLVVSTASSGVRSPKEATKVWSSSNHHYSRTSAGESQPGGGAAFVHVVGVGCVKVLVP